MHTHFDEVQFEKDLRATFAQMKADPQVHDEGSVVLERNQEVSVQFGMMACRELNRGTNIATLAQAGICAFLQFFGNIRTYVDADDVDELDKFVVADLSVGIASVITDDDAFETGNPAVMQEIKGGHA